MASLRGDSEKHQEGLGKCSGERVEGSAEDMLNQLPLWVTRA